MRTRRLQVALLTAAATVLAGGAGILAAPGNGSDDGAVDSAVEHHGHGHGQHGTTTGHLPAGSSNVALVSKLELTTSEGRIADVGVWNGHAYLTAFEQPACPGPENGEPDGGVYVVDIRDPSNPKKVGFIPIHQDSYAGEGSQALAISTPKFNGDLLVVNAEPCGKNQKGGFSLFDVTVPSKPVKLVSDYGDFNRAIASPGRDANAIHSAFAWDAGEKAYVVVVDDFEQTDVDIFDITDPRKPVFIAEYDLNEYVPQIVDPILGDGESFLHDMVVKPIGGRQVMLASYWDGGYVTLDVTNPAAATYIADSDFAFPDPLAAERGLPNRFAEGNAHQAEFTKENTHIISADEDFGPFAAAGTNVTEGSIFFTKPGGPALPLEGGQTVQGQTRFVGRACIGDPPPPAGNGTQFALVERGLCTFSEKLANIEAAGGYTAAVIFNRTGADACSGVFAPFVEAGIHVFFVGRKTGFDILNASGYDEAQCRTGGSPPLPAIGTTGDTLRFDGLFDGWGYIRLFANGSGKLVELDQFAIPQAHDPAHAQGSGDLSVHEIATSHIRNDLAYVSYYAGGFRVLRVAAGQLQEVGHFIDQGGNNFWGVQVFSHGGQEYVAASDRDYGLYIFKYTGSS